MAAPYPVWVCADCGVEYGKRPAMKSLVTWQDDICGVCGRFKPCTEPREFGQLKSTWKQAHAFWMAMSRKGPV